MVKKGIKNEWKQAMKELPGKIAIPQTSASPLPHQNEPHVLESRINSGIKAAPKDDDQLNEDISPTILPSTLRKPTELSPA